MNNQQEQLPTTLNLNGNINKLKMILEEKKEIANLFLPILKNNSIEINGKKYIKVSGWQAIASLYNLKILIKDIEKIDNGYLSQCQILDPSNDLISSQYGYAGFDELDIDNRKRKEYELVGLSQTRAVARALRNIFGYIISYLPDYEYSTFEEIMPIVKNYEEDPSEKVLKYTPSELIDLLKNKQIDFEEIEELTNNGDLDNIMLKASEAQQKYILDLIKKL